MKNFNNLNRLFINIININYIFWRKLNMFILMFNLIFMFLLVMMFLICFLLLVLIMEISDVTMIDYITNSGYVVYISDNIHIRDMSDIIDTTDLLDYADYISLINNIVTVEEEKCWLYRYFDEFIKLFLNYNVSNIKSVYFINENIKITDVESNSGISKIVLWHEVLRLSELCDYNVSKTSESLIDLCNKNKEIEELNKKLWDLDTQKWGLIKDFNQRIDILDSTCGSLTVEISMLRRENNRLRTELDSVNNIHFIPLDQISNHFN